ncbi:MAG: tetratricopeptide repeat protein [Acidobacteriota bacterium]|nr:tetratricopeptide repeat protein [Acidobacteriota bacterium]
MMKATAKPMALVAFVFGCLSVSGADSKACAGCHAEIYRRYITTPMARTSGIAGAASPRESFQHASIAAPIGGARYEIASSRSGATDALSFRFSDGEIRGWRSLDYFLGSGVVGRSYMTDIDGFLFQSPVSYYSNPAAWGISPGYERDAEINLTREVTPGCISCHATGLQPAPGTANGYAKPPFREAGVGCESCHGPAEEHIESSGRMGIVNPAKLDGWRRESVCARCHLPGAVEIARKTGGAYRPGDFLAASVAVFVWAAPEGETRQTTVNGHFEQLAKSACKQASGDKMWCGTCHDPHARASYREKCMTCHAVASCKAPSKVRATAGDQCAACHMPRAAAVTVQHASYTDHSIPKLPRSEAPIGIPSNARLVPFDGFSADDRELGLAYAAVAIPDSNRIWGTRALDLLSKVNEKSSDDVKVTSTLAALYDQKGNRERSCKLYARALALGDTAPVTAINYGTCVATEGRLEEAMRLWSGVAQTNPGNEAARLNLAVAQFRSGKVAQARANLSEALRFNPVSKRARELLHSIQEP